MMSEGTPEQKKLRRIRHEVVTTRPQRSPSRLRQYWRELLLGLLLIVSLIFLLNPWPLFWPEQVSEPDWPLTWQQQASNWLAYFGGSLQIGLVLLIVAVYGLGRQLVWQANHRSHFWRRHGCPACESKELKRIRRTRRDRLLNWLGVKTRRYVCADCFWEGLRVDDGRL